jgi:hypothetical protein
LRLAEPVCDTGVGPILAAVFVAEIGEVDRFRRAAQLASWAGLTPKHHESDTTVHRGPITKQGSRLVRWAAVEAIQRTDKHTRLGRIRDQVGARRGTNIGKVAAARELIELVFYGPARRAHPLPEPPQRMIPHDRGRTRVVPVMTPRPWASCPL